MLGLFTFSQQGADGAVYQMVAHGISTGALFLLAGYLEQRRGSMEIADFGGLATPAPGLAVAFMIALLASVGLPSLCNFIGEYLVLQGATVANHFTWAVWASIGIILSAVYMLWMYQRTFLGKTTTYTIDFPDLSMRDWVPLLPLFALMIWLGTYTQSFMPPISTANARILDQSKRSQEYQVQLYAPGSTTAIKEVAHAR